MLWQTSQTWRGRLSPGGILNATGAPQLGQNFMSRAEGRPYDTLTTRARAPRAAIRMRPSQIAAVLECEFAGAAAARTPVMLWGPPGVGKSQLVAQVAARHAVPLVDIRLAQMEPTDLRGIPFRDGRHVVWSVPAALPDAERHGPRGILFLDEITSAVPTVTAAAYQLILDRRLGEY